MELPFVVVALATLVPAGCQGRLPDWTEREVLELTVDRLVALQNEIAPSFELKGGHRIEFRSLDDFRPERISTLVPYVRDLIDRSDVWRAIETKLQGMNERQLRDLTENWLRNGVGKREIPQLEVFEASEVALAVDLIVVRLKSRSSQERQADLIGAISDLISDIEHDCRTAVNDVISDPRFCAIESTWRGLWYLVSNADLNEKLKVRVLPCLEGEAQNELSDVALGRQALQDTFLFKRLYEATFGMLGGAPSGLMVADWTVSDPESDVNALKGLSLLGAEMNCVCLTNASSHVLGLESWAEIENVRNPALLVDSPAYKGWNALRASPSSKWIGLCMPRVQGAPSSQKKSVSLSSHAADAGIEPPCLIGSAYAFAVNVSRAQNQFGWPAKIRGVNGGGLIEDMPFSQLWQTAVGERGVAEVAISDRRESALSELGFIPLINSRKGGNAAFLNAFSFYQSQVPPDLNSAGGDRVSGRLDVQLAIARFIHTIKCMLRDKVGSSLDADGCERLVNEWLYEYVNPDPGNSSEEAKARRPLAYGRMKIVDRTSIWSRARLDLRLNFQFEVTDTVVSQDFVFIL